VQAALGQPVVAETVAPPDVVIGGWRLGARIEYPVTRAVASYWRPATRSDDGTVYTVELEPPVDIGDYQLVWRTDDPSEDVNTPENTGLAGQLPVYEAFVPLAMIDQEAAAVIEQDFPPVDRSRITPTCDDVGALERTRTIDDSGNDVGTFTDTTHPTCEEVDSIIEQAVDDVLLELPEQFKVTHYDSIKRAVTFYAATLIETSYYREEMAPGTPGDVYRTRYERMMGSMKERIEADRDRSYLVARGATGLQ
jgi:hypothetical protein